MKQIFSALMLLLLANSAQAKQFEIFDNQFYNGKHYPIIDIIEWGEQDGGLAHLEFHVHSKTRPIEVSAVPGEKGGKPVLWIMYDLTFRNERICRHVLAPSHFKEGMKLYTYKDSSDSDYENIYVSSKPMQGKKLVEYKMPGYQPCTDEFASNWPGASGGAHAEAQRLPASGNMPQPVGETTQPATDSGKKQGKDVGVDYENNAVPFSF
jgi:hypothetical protein